MWMCWMPLELSTRFNRKATRVWQQKDIYILRQRYAHLLLALAWEWKEYEPWHERRERNVRDCEVWVEQTYIQKARVALCGESTSMPRRRFLVNINIPLTRFYLFLMLLRFCLYTTELMSSDHICGSHSTHRYHPHIIIHTTQPRRTSPILNESLQR